MAAGAIGGGMGFMLLSLAVPGRDPVILPAADVAIDVAPDVADVSFDLAAASLAQPRPDPAARPVERFTKPHLDPSQLADPAWTPPSKTWGNAGRGPILQIGALGSKDKRVPKLAHIAFDWDF